HRRRPDRRQHRKSARQRRARAGGAVGGDRGAVRAGRRRRSGARPGTTLAGGVGDPNGETAEGGQHSAHPGLDLSQITTYAEGVGGDHGERTGPTRVTVPVLQVIDLLLAQPSRDDWFALEICRQTGLGSGTVAQILFRLRDWGWVTSRWEDATEAHRQGRPRRRFYLLTGRGAAEARQVLRGRFPGIAGWAP